VTLRNRYRGLKEVLNDELPTVDYQAPVATVQ